DLRNGVTPDAFRYFKDSPERRITVDAAHVGYRDQRYKASLDQFGKLKISFEWNQIPLFFSESTQALHTVQSPGVLRIDDAIQTGIERSQTTLPAVVGLAVPFDLRLKRSIADARVSYAATDTIDVNLFFKNTLKAGDQPWAGTFG